MLILVSGMFSPSPEVFAQGADAVTGSVRGTIELPPAGIITRRNRGARYRGAVREADESPTNAEMTNVVVYLEGRNLSGRGENRKPVLDQRNATFVPHVLPIVKGETVDITNRDKTYHNVFSLSTPRKFNIGRRPTGEAVPVRFDESGVVQVFCDIHSHMTAFIVILENAFYSQPGKDGKFSIDGVPPGNYTVHVWHERYSANPQQVTVQSGKTVVTDFFLQ